MENGLRLFATYYLVDEKGIARIRNNPAAKNPLAAQHYYFDLKYHGMNPKEPKNCITVRLTSDPKSTVSQ